MVGVSCFIFNMTTRNDSDWYMDVCHAYHACHAMRRWKTSIKSLASGFILPGASSSYPASNKPDTYATSKMLGVRTWRND